MGSQVNLPGSVSGSGPRMYLGWNYRAVMKKRCGQTKKPQLPEESLVGKIFPLAFFMIVISEGVDFGVSQLDSLT